MHRPSILLLLVFLAFGALSACDLPRAHGDRDAVIIAADEELWYAIEDDFRDRMEPTVQTVRAERPFRITHHDPEQQGWGQLRRFRQIAVMGPRGNQWVEEALEKADDPNVSAPAVVEATNVWARGQRVWIMLLPDNDVEAAVADLTSAVRERLDTEFRREVHTRMFISGRDSILADSLARNVGFSLELPNVYRYEAGDTVFRFRNDNPSPTELIREISVTWRESLLEEDPTREELMDWRLQLTRDHYVNAQDLDTTIVSYGPIEMNGARGVELQSAWVSPPDAWPSGGPFITRVVRCAEEGRTYFLDAWLYAPNRAKYEYVIQLQTILDSFRCH